MKTNAIIIVAGAAVAALAIAACGGSPAPSGAPAAGTSTATTQPAAGTSSPVAATQNAPPNAWHGQVGNTQVTAWCTVYPNTDENGDPLDAWVISYYNQGPYKDELFGVGLKFYDAAGQLIGDAPQGIDDFSLTDGSLGAMEVPAGSSTIGTNPPSNLGDGYNEAPGDAKACTIARFS